MAAREIHPAARELLESDALAHFVTINPDGSVEAKLGTQDLGTGARTVVGIVVAETLGLPLEAVKVQIGKNQFPNLVRFGIAAVQPRADEQMLLSA